MGKTSGKRQPLSQTAKPESPQAGKPTSMQADKLVSRQTIHVLLIFVIGFLAYSNTFHSPFQWDESDFIVGNPVIRDLGYFAGTPRTEGLPVIEGFKSRYMAYLTFALNYRLHGFDVVGYHIVNLAIHIVNAILVYFLVLMTLRTPHFSNQQSAVSSQQSTVKSKKSVVSSKKEEAGDDGFSLLTTHYSLFTTYYSRIFALAVALLFVCHPVQTEAVTYVFQRFASLVSMFYLLSLVLYIKAKLKLHSAEGTGQSVKDNTQGIERVARSAIFSSRGPMPYALCSLLFAVLAMKTKENAFTLPVVIALYEFLFFAGPVITRLLRLAPFLLTMLIVPASILGTGATAGEIIGGIKNPAFLDFQNISAREYLFTQFRVIITYLRLLFLPVNQNLVYDYPVYRSFFALPVLFSFLFLSAIFGAAVYLLQKAQRAESKAHSVENGKLHAPGPMPYAYYRLIAFGIFWFFITLSVESSVIPIPMVMDEYRVYLPSVGFFIAATAGVLLLVNRLATHSAKTITQSAESKAQKEKNAMRFFRGPMPYALCPMLLALLILGLAAATYARNTLWKDKVSLWEDVLRKSPSSTRAYNNLGLAYNEKGLQERAIGMYLKAIAINPDFSLAYSNLGVAYAGIGRREAAIESFTKALALNPKNALAYSNIARAYGETGHPDKAVENYRRAIALRPFDSSAYHGLGTAYVMLGLLDDALEAYTTFITLSPDNAEAYRSRGIVYAKKGDARDAAADFERACALGSKESCGYLKSGRS
jgi:Flp pilus assembly protein TadD